MERKAPTSPPSASGIISVTPIHLDLTNYTALRGDCEPRTLRARMAVNYEGRAAEDGGRADRGARHRATPACSRPMRTGAAAPLRRGGAARARLRDSALPIGERQTISQPYMVARDDARRSSSPAARARARDRHGIGVPGGGARRARRERVLRRAHRELVPLARASAWSRSASTTCSSRWATARSAGASTHRTTRSS